MERKSVPSERVWSHVGYSRAVRVGNLIEVAGTSASAPGGVVVAPGDMYGQAKYCIEVIQKAIEELGGSIEDVVRTRVFLKIGRAPSELQSRENLVCRLLLEK